MDPGVRSQGMKVDPPGYLWSKYECFLMSGWWDIPQLRNCNVKLWSNSSNGTELKTNERTDERTEGKTKTIYLRHKLAFPSIVFAIFYFFSTVIRPESVSLFVFFLFEPRHNKTSKVTVRPAKTQMSLGIRPVLRTAETLIRLGGCPGWSESSLGVKPFRWFCYVGAHFLIFLLCSLCIWTYLTEYII